MVRGASRHSDHGASTEPATTTSAAAMEDAMAHRHFPLEPTGPLPSRLFFSCRWTPRLDRLLLALPWPKAWSPAACAARRRTTDASTTTSEGELPARPHPLPMRRLFFLRRCNLLHALPPSLSTLTDPSERPIYSPFLCFHPVPHSLPLAGAFLRPQVKAPRARRRCPFTSSSRSC